MNTLLFRRILFLFAVLVLVSLACSLPMRTEEPEISNDGSDPSLSEIDTLPLTPTVTPPPTPTAQPLPPTLVEAKPAPGSDIPLKGPLTFYFDQPMDRGSVEGALVGNPELSGMLTWVDDATLIFEPDADLPTSLELTVELGTTALAENGLAMLEPVRLTYQTASPLQAVQVLPLPGTVEADPSSAIVAVFDQPVVHLGANPNTLPHAFSLEPSATGQGEWINTSTYIFYADPPMVGGTTYNVSLNKELRSTTGSPFSGLAENQGYTWSFSTTSPLLLNALPEESASLIPLDTIIEMEFNQSMDEASVKENFSVLAPGDVELDGAFAWDENFTTMVFTPTGLLDRDVGYTIYISGQALSLGGTPLSVDYRQRFFTVPDFYVTWTEPEQAGRVQRYQGVRFHFSAPLDETDLLKYISVSPSVSNLSYWFPQSDSALNINGDFKPETEYQVRLSESLPDRWGQNLGKDYILQFRTEPLQPALHIAYGESQLFITPKDATLSAQAANIGSVDLSIGRIPEDQIWQYLGPTGYDTLNNVYPSDAEYWNQPLDVSNNQFTTVGLPLTPDEKALPPGLYHYQVSARELVSPNRPLLIISSHVHMTFKISPTQAFVWAVDLRNSSPVSNTPIHIYDFNGNILTNGSTDSDGIFKTTIPARPDIYDTYYAILGDPGDDQFSLTFSSWNSGLQGYDFGIRTDFRGPHTTAYLYTDRPVYRPGQTVHFRTIVRHARNGRYTMPDIGILPVNITDGNYQPLLDMDLPLSEFGTASGQFDLSDQAVPGFYTIITPHNSVTFQVAEYRKPEIDFQVSVSPNPAIMGQKIMAQVEARYYFDSPAGNIPLHWEVHAVQEDFWLPGFTTGVNDYGWVLPPWMGGYPYGELISSGEGRTGQNGLLSIEIPTTLDESTQRYTIEVTLQDESGFLVSSRAEVVLHPDDFYIGVRPDTWVGVAGDEIGYEIKVVDWMGDAAGKHKLTARFQKITWVRGPKADIYAFPVYSPEYTPISSSDFQTSNDGMARLVFTAPESGTYELEISGGGAVTRHTVWVVGQGQTAWPKLPNQQLNLRPDQEAYEPGETAKIFIPNPLGEGAQALVTVERGEVLRHQVLTMDGSGYTLELPLDGEDAPNVYLAVTMIGPGIQEAFDFRQGYLNLEVEPLEHTLNVSLTPIPPVAGPRDEVSFIVRVSDADGKPVQGEFSLAIIDKAVLALADPYSAGIVDAFYGTQPLGVRTGLGLAAYAHRFVDTPGGLGGGGGGEIPMSSLREDFPDTAYWNAEIITNEVGEAVISLALPDNLTTWVASTRGLTINTLVGEAETELIVTKDLLVRPVTPRFLVIGDHLRLMGLVHNNTKDDLTVDVRLQSAGFLLDNPDAEIQTVAVPAGGRTPVEWWGTVEAVEMVDLIFSAEGGGYSDATRPVWGDLPVLGYSAPQTFGTAGTMDAGGERLEIVSLPRSFDSDGGSMRVELAPSLAAAILPGLDVLEHYPYECTEQTLSRFLPNLETYLTLQELGLESIELEARLQRTLNDGLQRLAARQNEDGGWSWWPGTSTGGTTSDPYITAYVLFGLTRARSAGIFVDDRVIQQAVNFLTATLPAPEMLSESWQLDRLTFQFFALSQADSGNLSGVGVLYESRSQLSPWAQAFLALTLETISPEDPRIRELYSDLEASSIRTASGAHWEGHGAGVNMETPAFTTAVVVYALAQHDPASNTIPEAVRYLMASRGTDGAWASTYETAWSILSLTQVMKGTGDLAGNFEFGAALNGINLIESTTGGDAKLSPVSASVNVSSLYPQDPNALTLQRGDGPGRLYYSAHLTVFRPVEDVASLDRGINISRAYETIDGQPLTDGSTIQSMVGDAITVKVAVTVKNSAYYLIVEDFVPAGAEILDVNLKINQQVAPTYDPRDPFGAGWGWWYFNEPQIYDERIAWSVDFLPAGTYELTYALMLSQPGEYRVIPSRAWEFYFPETQGNGAGVVFSIVE